MRTRVDQQRRDLSPGAAAGLRELRSQHLQIYTLVARLYRPETRSGDERGVRLALLEEVIARVETHFEAEERVLRMLSLPSYHEQSSAHAQILQGLLEQRNALRGGDGSSNLDLQRALDALLIHGVADDRAFERFEPQSGGKAVHSLH